MRAVRLSACLLTMAAVLVACPAPARALIDRLTPLATLIDDSDEIFVARFERVDAEKRTAVLVWDKDLKAETDLRRLPVRLTGDKERHTPEFLKRIAPKLPVVLFVTHLDNKLLALGYTDGTWFQMIGTPGRAGEPTRWAFTHCEIYLRRTFKGTTKEMITVVGDALSGKQKPPQPNPKEPAGLGPEVKPEPAEAEPANETRRD